MNFRYWKIRGEYYALDANRDLSDQGVEITKEEYDKNVTIPNLLTNDNKYQSLHKIAEMFIDGGSLAKALTETREMLNLLPKNGMTPEDLMQWNTKYINLGNVLSYYNALMTTAIDRQNTYKTRIIAGDTPEQATKAIEAIKFDRTIKEPATGETLVKAFLKGILGDSYDEYVKDTGEVNYYTSQTEDAPNE